MCVLRFNYFLNSFNFIQSLFVLMLIIFEGGGLVFIDEHICYSSLIC